MTGSDTKALVTSVLLAVEAGCCVDGCPAGAVDDPPVGPEKPEIVPREHPAVTASTSSATSTERPRPRIRSSPIITPPPDPRHPGFRRLITGPAAAPAVITLSAGEVDNPQTRRPWTYSHTWWITSS
jgi:hypothetical protein